MERGKLIVIAGTDCSGKETQTKILVEKLNNAGIKTELMSFPMYDTPTGKIAGGPYLGKQEISECWFPEGANAVNPKVSSLYYAADRLYNLPKINEILDSGVNLVLDRYVSANMAHQGGKIEDASKRDDFYKFLESLEHDLLGLPRPDSVFFLYVPYQIGEKLKKGREGNADQHEKNPDHLKNSEKAYLELAKKYDWHQIDCEDFIDFEDPERGIRKISEILYDKVLASIA